MCVHWVAIIKCVSDCGLHRKKNFLKKTAVRSLAAPDSVVVLRCCGSF